MSHPRTRLILALLVALGAGSTPLAAQDGERTIDPGMTREQVIERLGKPLNERRAGNATFLFYANGCERTCGMNDLVVLDDGRVIDAIFRAAGRRYTGESSSPVGVTPERTAPGAGGDAAGAVRRAGRGGIILASPAEGEETGRPAATITGVEVTSPDAPPRGEQAPRPAGGTAGAPLGGNAPQITTPGGNAPQVTAPGGNAPQVSTPGGNAPQTSTVGGGGAAAGQPAGSQRPIMPVPLPGAKVNPADSVRALTPNRPTPLPGAKLNPADSARAEAIRRQQADTTRRPPR